MDSMRRKLIVFGSLLCLSAGPGRADFSYEQTSKITGGVMAGAMRLAGAFSSKARQPMKQTVVLKGDRMATIGAGSANVIDIGKETITEINFEQKTYSVVTFAEMAEAMKRMQAKMQGGGRQQADVEYKISVKDTGQTRQIAGLNTRQMLLLFAIEGTDKKSGEKGAMNMIADMWLAPDVPGYAQVRDFYRRMGQKMAWTPGMSGMAGAQPGMMKGMAEVAKEASKLDGIPVLQILYLGVTPEAMAQAQAGKAPQPTPENAQEGPSVGQAAGKAAEESAAGAIAGRLGRLGGVGGLGRREKEEAPPEPATAAGAAPGPEAPPPPPQAQERQAQGAALLMEMTTELSGFSSAPVDAAKLEVPAGFKQVESEMVKALRN